jgi:predicted DsbA family dithiol-disulfide isomerase/Skp family chaperone for outer membrane proteins
MKSWYFLRNLRQNSERLGLEDIEKGHFAPRRSYCLKLNRELVLLAMLAFAGGAYAQSTPDRVAVVNGQTITQQQLEKAAETDLKNLELKRLQNESSLAQDKQQILTKALEEMVAERLLDAEAAKEKKTKEQLLEAEVNSNVDTPSKEEVEAFYEANKDRIPIPKDQALPQVKEYLMERSRAQYQDMLLARLKKEFGYKSYLEPLRSQIATEGFPSRGPANAPVTIVEFSDFECPYCGGLFPTLKQVEKNYPTQVRIVYRQFPLTNIHPHAQKAAEAALCANEQGKFWEFHDSMFGNQSELSVADLKQRAVDLKLNTQAFNECLDSGRMAAAIKADIQEGARSGVTGTPAMFINGRLLSGNQPYAEIKAVIDDELQRKGSK